MTYIHLLALAIFMIPSAWSSSGAVLEENLYYSYQKSILSSKNTTLKSANGFSVFEQSLYVDALWNLVEEGSPAAFETLDTINTLHYDLMQRLRIGILRIKHKKKHKLAKSLLKDLENSLKAPEAPTKLVYTIAAYEALLLEAGHQRLVNLAQKYPEYTDISQDADKRAVLTKDVIGDLFYNSPELSGYLKGEYTYGIKIFMFCRENRLYPCLMVMRDHRGEVVRNLDGSMWTHRALASSKRGLPSHITNGNTPQGIHTIDSVMPVADEPMSFGKFRRMILNAVPKSKNEKNLKLLVPPSSHDSTWWKPSVVARDIGRGLFRIHGSGKINQTPQTPFYPFMQTSGCIAQRENTYGEITYQDQRKLLDKVMQAMDLKVEFENEKKIKGIIYLMEIDKEEGPVTREDLTLRGIE